MAKSRFKSCHHLEVKFICCNVFICTLQRKSKSKVVITLRWASALHTVSRLPLKKSLNWRFWNIETRYVKYEIRKGGEDENLEIRFLKDIKHISVSSQTKQSIQHTCLPDLGTCCKHCRSETARQTWQEIQKVDFSIDERKFCIHPNNAHQTWQLRDSKSRFFNL